MEDNREFKISEVDKKKKEYLDYINNHITNVKKVWDRVRIFLVEAQMTPEIIDEVDRNIPFHDVSKFLSSEFEGYRQFFYQTSEEIRSVDVLMWLGITIVNTIHTIGSIGLYLKKKPI